MRPEKKLMGDEYKTRLQRSRSVVVTEFSPISAPTLDRLRRKLERLEAEYLVVKNRIFKKAIENSEFSDLNRFIQHPAAVALGEDNLPEIAKLLLDFEKEEGSPRIKAAIWGNDVFEAAAVKRLAGLPPRPVLLSHLLGRIQAPLANLTGLLNQLITGLVRALSEIRQKKQA